MPKELLVNFISDFVRNTDDLRCKVLKNEYQAPLDYGLTQTQVDILNSYNPDRILCELYNELLGLKVDVLRKKAENGGAWDPPASPPKNCTAIFDVKMMAASAYQAGAIHGRGIKPPTVPAGNQTVTIIGNGFEISTIEVQFKKGIEPPKPANIVARACEVDLYQKLTVRLNLTAGTWRAEFRNSPAEAWTEGDRPLDLEVT